MKTSQFPDVNDYSNFVHEIVGLMQLPDLFPKIRIVPHEPEEEWKQVDCHFIIAASLEEPNLGIRSLLLSEMKLEVCKLIVDGNLEFRGLKHLSVWPYAFEFSSFVDFECGLDVFKQEYSYVVTMNFRIVEEKCYEQN